MDNIRQERLRESPVLSLNKRLKIKFTKHEICNTRQEIYGLEGLEKVNNATLPELKLLAQNPRVGLKIWYFSKVKDLLIQKLGNISIRCLIYS